MRRSSLILTFILVIGFVLSGCGSIADSKETTVASKSDVELTEVTNDISLLANNTTVTMRDIADFLQDKKEHYPLSDEFVERYQQTSGGYLDYAKEKGLIVDKEQHEPNQKWHFFDSWMYPKINDENDSLKWDSSAKTRVYNNLICPELLLWIFEASGVAPSKVQQAKQIAEQGKSANTGTSTIASQMKQFVPWEDIESAILNQDYTMQKISVKSGDGFNVTGIQSEHRVGGQVIFTVNVTDSTKEIDEVRVNNEIVTAASGTTYKFIMPDEEVTISVILRDIPPKAVLSTQSLKLTVGGEDATITARVEPNGTTDAAVWSILEGTDVISITPNGNEVTVHALKKGVAKVKVTYAQDISAECTITVKEPSEILQAPVKYGINFDLGTRKTAKELTTVEEVFATFALISENNGIIDSVVKIEKIYGGGNGGSGETAWYVGNMLKFGTQKVNGLITLALNAEVNRIKITGYVQDKACKIRVGDSNSAVWTGGTDDNLTTLVTCTDMNVTTKTVVEGGETSTITIDFKATDSLTIATTNAKPLYITAIEFEYVPELAQ